MTDKNIKRYQLEVEVEDSGVFMKKCESLTKCLVTQARDDGYVPLLDLPTYVTVHYEEERFHYIITVQTVYVGRKKAWHTDGVLNGREVLKNTPAPKLGQ